MATLLYQHPDFLLHDTGLGHPESPDRLKAVDKALSSPEFAGLSRMAAPEADSSKLQLIHTPQHIERIFNSMPQQGLAFIDGDTVVSAGSKTAALRAAGAVCDAVDRVLSKHADNAFCAVRPPGHHAEPDRAMGFCLFNNVAIAAEYARRHHHLERIAIVDFDVHHGNGTQKAFYQQPNVLYASSHQMPHYPGTGDPSETGAGNIVNVALKAGEGSEVFRHRYQKRILPAVTAFKPDLILISAGFDAHKLDPLASIQLMEADYQWLTEELVAIANTSCEGRLVSVLEGGYHLSALAASVAGHVKALMSV